MAAVLNCYISRTSHLLFCWNPIDLIYTFLGEGYCETKDLVRVLSVLSYPFSSNHSLVDVWFQGQISERTGPRTEGATFSFLLNSDWYVPFLLDFLIV